MRDYKQQEKFGTQIKKKQNINSAPKCVMII